MTSIVVTGATGFVGGHIVKGLSRYAPVAVGRNRSALERLQQEDPGVSCEQLDLTAPNAVERLVAHRPSLIIHAAARSSPWGTLAEFEAANVQTTNVVIAAATACEVPVIYLSTPSIYMDSTHRTMIKEDDPLPSTFVNDYTATKYEGELAVRRFCETGLPAVTLRPQAIVGSGDTTLAPRFLRVIDKGFLPLFDGGNAILDMTSVENVVDAVRLSADALLAGSLEGIRTFNVTNGDPRPIRELLGMILDVRAKLVPDSSPPRKLSISAQHARRVAGALEKLSHISGGWEPPLTRHSVDLLAFDRTLSIAAVQETLGFAPESHQLEDSIASYFGDDRTVSCHS